MNQNTSAARTSTTIATIEGIVVQGERENSNTGILHQYIDSSNVHIPSPPAINNWHTMSTAATTVTSNIQPRLSLYQQNERLPPMLPMIVPANRRYQADVVIEDDAHSSNVDVPPVCEIQIPSQHRLKRQADSNNDEDFDENNDEDDADTTTSTQNLSRDEHHHYNAIDYKGMYFTSQRQNYALREHVQCVQEENRKLKRQLIEMQKQLYTYSRNKRTAVASSMYKSSNHDTREVVPWSIPLSSTNIPRRHYHHHHDQHRVLMVRHPPTSNVIENSQTEAAPTTGSAASSSIPGITTASPTNGVSMSVSSEEGTIIH